MRQIVYTCLKCKKQEFLPIDDSNIPFGWAAVKYERYHAGDDDTTKARVAAVGGAAVCTHVETHACGDCALEVLDFLDPKPPAAPSLKSA